MTTSVYAATQKPDVLFIVADDLGYSDPGAFGGEIDIPNLKELIKHSTQLESLYVVPICSPIQSEFKR
jgi:arylsulfatase A-like enzyme